MLGPPVTDPPDIPGLGFRIYRGEEDLPQMLEVANAAWLAAGSERKDSLEAITATYRNLTDSDPHRDVLLAEVDGRIVAYCRVLSRAAVADGRHYYNFGRVKPEWLRRGLGTAMHRWAEQRLLEIAAEHPRHPNDVIYSWASDKEKGTHALLLASGYQPVTYDADMVRPNLDDLPPAHLPEGFEVRTPGESEMRKVWEADVEAFRDHWGATEPQEGDYRRFLEDPHNDPTLWCIAWDGDEVAAQVRSFINEAENEGFNRKRGYTEDISTRAPYRRRGLARALLAMSLRVLRERGMEEAALGVHTENPRGALGLYESAGFRTVLLTTTYEKPLPD